MNREIQNPEDAIKYAIEMVPDGQFDRVETAQRRRLWQLWLMLPPLLRTQPRYPDILARTLDEPLGWVYEVLNLDTAHARS